MRAARRLGARRTSRVGAFGPSIPASDGAPRAARDLAGQNTSPRAKSTHRTRTALPAGRPIVRPAARRPRGWSDSGAGRFAPATQLVDGPACAARAVPAQESGPHARNRPLLRAVPAGEAVRDSVTVFQPAAPPTRRRCGARCRLRRRRSHRRRAPPLWSEAPQSVSTPFVWVALLLRYWDWYDGTGILAPAVCRLLSVRRTDAVKWCEM